jgi:hypothetical protein
MKNYFKFLVPALFVFAVSCTEEDDTSLPGNIITPIFSEDFERPTGEPVFAFETDGQAWTNFAQAGTKIWFLNQFGTPPDHYLEFSSFGSGQASNIGWIISPAVNIDSAEKKRLVFQSAQHHATNEGNEFDVLVSDNFDGVNVMAATWTVKSFRKPEYTGATNYDMVPSGVIDLSEYSGEIHIAWRVKGDGLSNSEFDGGFQIDNIKVF